MATKEQVTRAILALRYLPNSPITPANIPEIVSMFEVVLSDLPAKTLDAATRQYLSTETFFPTPGRIRELAMDLQMIAMGVPTPAEAWGMIINAIQHVPSMWCEDGAAIREIGDVFKYKNHMDNCGVCTTGGLREVYQSAAVESTVKMLGGRDAIITDNPTADRARFTDAYREVISRERTKTAMLPEVKGYIEQKRAALLDTGQAMKQLTKGLTK